MTTQQIYLEKEREHIQIYLEKETERERERERLCMSVNKVIFFEKKFLLFLLITRNQPLIVFLQSLLLKSLKNERKGT